MDDTGFPEWLSPKPPELAETAAEFLQAEYQHAATSFISNEESGERRISLFLSFVGVAAAALGFAVGSLDDTVPETEWLVGLAATLVLLIGLMTLRRTIGRNVHADELVNAMARLRSYYIAVDPDVARVLPFVPPATPKRRKRGEPSGRWWGLGNAGTLEMAGLANSYLFGAIVGAVIAGFGGASGVWLVAASVAALSFWFAQMWYAHRVYCRLQETYVSDRRSSVAFWLDINSSAAHADKQAS